MVLGSAAAGATTRNRWITPGGEAPATVHQRRRRTAAGAAGPCRSSARSSRRSRPSGADGHRVGKGRRDRNAVHRAGAPGDGAIASRAGDGHLATLDGHGEGKLLRGAAASATRSSTGTGLCHPQRDGAGSAFVPGRPPRGRISTDPDWVPGATARRRRHTEHGGRTCHAAIVSRANSAFPAIVGGGGATDRIAMAPPHHAVVCRRRGRPRLRRRGAPSGRRSRSTPCRRRAPR